MKIISLSFLFISTLTLGTGQKPPEDPNKPVTPMERTKKDLKTIQDIGAISQITKISVKIPGFFQREIPIHICGGEQADFEWKAIDIGVTLTKIGMDKMSIPISKEFYVNDEAGDLPEEGNPNSCQSTTKPTPIKFPYDPPKKNSSADDSTPNTHGVLITKLNMKELEIGVDINILIQGLHYKPKNITVNRFEINKGIDVTIKDLHMPIDLHAFREKAAYYIAPKYREKEFTIGGIELKIDGLPKIVNQLLSSQLSDRLSKMASEALMQQVFQ